MYPTQLNIDLLYVRAGFTVKKEHEQDADGHSSTLQASNPHSRALPSTPSSSIDVVKKEDTDDHHSSPLRPRTNTQIHQPGAQQIPYEQKIAMIKHVVASAIEKSMEYGSPEVGQFFGQTLSLLFEQATGNPVLLDLYATVCSGIASAKKLKDFKVFMQYSRKLFHHERKNRDKFFAQEHAEIGAELAQLDARLTQAEEETEARTNSNTGGYFAAGYPLLTEMWKPLAKLKESMVPIKQHHYSDEILRDLLQKYPHVPSEEAPANRLKTRLTRPQAQIIFNGTNSHGIDIGSGSDSGTEFPPAKRPQTRPIRPQARNQFNKANTQDEDDGSGSDSGTEFPPVKKPRLHRNVDDDDGSVKGEEAESRSDGPTPAFPPFKVVLGSGRRL
ncbi:MAG: hypothetical protein L6R36_000869 [Xanthoria steineri]|nr:MAG: hypothetical protein L6R36_000869 [Xanthoria steineri]